MTSEQRARLHAVLNEAEGRRAVPYRDTQGVLTVGVGHRTDEDSIPLTGTAIDAILDGDLDAKEADCARRIELWESIDPVRQTALIELAFNGVLFASPKALQYVNMRQWVQAGTELLDGPWKTQVGLPRALRLVRELRSGQTT